MYSDPGRYVWILDVNQSQNVHWVLARISCCVLIQLFLCLPSTNFTVWIEINQRRRKNYGFTNRVLRYGTQQLLWQRDKRRSTIVNTKFQFSNILWIKYVREVVRSTEADVLYLSYWFFLSLEWPLVMSGQKRHRWFFKQEAEIQWSHDLEGVPVGHILAPFLEINWASSVEGSEISWGCDHGWEPLISNIGHLWLHLVHHGTQRLVAHCCSGASWTCPC